jgi:hypothetical protein
VLDVLNGLHVSSSAVLQRVDSLVLTLPAAEPAGAAQHKAFAAYQHLFQKSGFEDSTTPVLLLAGQADRALSMLCWV